MKEKPYKKNVVLLSTHIVNDFVIHKYRKLYHDLDNEKYDIILLLNLEEGDEWSIPDDVTCYTTNSERINELEYNPIAETLLPGSCHFPVLRFFTDITSYKFYWFVEYDVEFTGSWQALIQDCDENLHDYDFMSCHVETFDERNKYWPWWYRGNNVGVALEECIKGFNPICRYSNGALAYIDCFQRLGNSAHSEVLITTCLHKKGFKIGDFGGNGDFVPNGYENKFYFREKTEINGGTMRYRPIYTRAEIEKTGLENKLFHPIKQ